MKNTLSMRRSLLTFSAPLAFAFLPGILYADSERTNTVVSHGKSFELKTTFEGTPTSYTRRSNDRFSVGYYVKDGALVKKASPDKFAADLKERQERSDHYKSWTADKLRKMTKDKGEDEGLCGEQAGATQTTICNWTCLPSLRPRFLCQNQGLRSPIPTLVIDQTLSNSVQHSALLVDYKLISCRRFGPRLSVIEAIHSRETGRIGRLASTIDVVPALGIEGTGKSFVKCVQPEKPASVYHAPVCINVRRFSIVALRNSCAFTKVAGLGIAFCEGGIPITPDVKVAPVGGSGDASILLEVACPGIAGLVSGFAVRLEMKPSVRRLGRGQVFVETECSEESLCVSWDADRRDMKSTGLVPRQPIPGSEKVQR